MNTLTASLYESDFYGWTQHQADALRSKNIAVLDFDNLLEEIEAMGRGEKRSLKSRLSAILTHLLKWRYQSERRGRNWQLTIAEQRDQARDILDENPSLKLAEFRLYGKNLENRKTQGGKRSQYRSVNLLHPMPMVHRSNHG